MYYITFSRKTGAGGTEIAQRVAQALHYAFYDTEDIENKAREMGFLDDIREVNDKAPPPLQRFFSYRPEVSLDRLYRVIYDLARQGSAVILGRGGNMIFRSLPNALHVRVTASPETRLRNLAERGFRKHEAAMAMEKTDHERGNFIRFAFRRDWDNPELYDVVLNMDKLTVVAAADIILCAARAVERQGPPEDAAASLAAMELAARVGTALAEAGFPSHYVSAFVYEPGKVRLTGVVQVPWEKTEAERIAGSVAGIGHVENAIEIAGR